MSVRSSSDIRNPKPYKCNADQSNAGEHVSGVGADSGQLERNNNGRHRSDDSIHTSGKGSGLSTETSATDLTGVCPTSNTGSNSGGGVEECEKSDVGGSGSSARFATRGGICDADSEHGERDADDTVEDEVPATNFLGVDEKEGNDRGTETYKGHDYGSEESVGDLSNCEEVCKRSGIVMCNCKRSRCLTGGIGLYKLVPNKLLGDRREHGGECAAEVCTGDAFEVGGIRGVGRVLTLFDNGVFDLVDNALDFVAGSVGVQFAETVLGVLYAVLQDKPVGRLGAEQQHADKGESGCCETDVERHSPATVIVDIGAPGVITSPGRERSNQ